MKVFLLAMILHFSHFAYSQNRYPNTQDVLNVTGHASPTPKSDAMQNTYRELDRQENSRASKSTNSFGLQTDLTIGHDRAESMVKIIQDTEMKKALEKISAKGDEIMRKNPEIRTPVGILAGAMGLWIGKTMRVMKSGDTKITTSVEGKSKSGRFNMESPLLNGELKFQQDTGMNVGVNRSITSINTSASFNYNVSSQSMTTHISQRIAPNLDLSLGAGQSAGKATTEGTASLLYQLHF